MRFLVDEYLSPEPTKVAHAEGYGKSSHVVWLGRASLKDWELRPIVLEGDWTFVTKNSIDFRGPAERPGRKGQYADVVAFDQQLEMFEWAGHRAIVFVATRA